MKNEKLVLLYEANKTSNIAVKTPFGLSDRFTVEDIIMQGTVFGPLKCTTSMNKLGEKAYRSGKPLLLYKNTVKIRAARR